MQWRPFLASELAVGCSTGLLIWNVDPCSVVARPSAGKINIVAISDVLSFKLHTNMAKVRYFIYEINSLQDLFPIYKALAILL